MSYWAVIIIILLIILIIAILIKCCFKEQFRSELNKFPIDVVYTWVDTADPIWRAKYEKYNQNKGFNARVANTPNSWDELELSVSSVRKFMPWVRNIFIITQRPQTPPNWMVAKYGLKVVHHDEIGINFDTFNSMSIESCMHKIPELAEHFIYFNDDMYVLKPIDRTVFFTPRGKPVCRIMRKRSMIMDTKSDALLGEPNSHIRNLQRCRDLVKTLGMRFYCITHFPSPMRKRLMGKTAEMFPDDWEYTKKSINRMDDNVIPMYLASSVGMDLNKCKIASLLDDIKMFFSENDIPPMGVYHIICINSIKPKEFEKLKATLIKNMKHSKV